MQKFVIWISGSLLLACSFLASAQQKSADLNAVEERLISSFEKQFAGSIRTPVTPMEGSVDVAINGWKLNDSQISVTIICYSSKEQALARIR